VIPLAVGVVVGGQMNGLENKLKVETVLSSSFVEKQVVMARGE